VGKCSIGFGGTVGLRKKGIRVDRSFSQSFSGFLAAVDLGLGVGELGVEGVGVVTLGFRFLGRSRLRLRMGWELLFLWQLGVVGKKRLFSATRTSVSAVSKTQPHAPTKETGDQQQWQRSGGLNGGGAT
jgi:hypothetical protein